MAYDGVESTVSPRRRDTRRRSVRWAAAALGMALTTSSVTAGGSGENAVLVVDPSRPDALAVANAYRRARRIPAVNVVYLRPADGSGFVAQRTSRFAALEAELVARGIADHVDYVVLAPTERYRVEAGGLLTDECFPAGGLGVSTAYGLLPMGAELAAGGLDVTEPNRYFDVSGPLRGFASRTAWLDGAPSTDAAARRYRIGALLGWTGPRGNSVDTLRALVTRSAGADGSRPTGTFVFHHTADVARSGPRHDVFPSVVSAITALGGAAVVDAVETLPKNRHDVLGVMTGVSDPKIAAGEFTLLPGAFCDHLTSWAADFDRSDQVKVSAWIDKGASASVGAVEEPCNYPGKFPRAELHRFVFEGATLGEAWFRSTEYVPFQMLFYGDPLTRPFAHVPTVSLAGLTADAPLSGHVQLTPSATTSRPGGAVSGFDLLVDGVQLDSVGPGGTFELHTCDLDDGVHEVRVLAHEQSLLGTTGRRIDLVRVDNRGLTAALVPVSDAGSLSTAFAFDLDAGGGEVESIELHQASRVVASVAGGAGRVVVHGRLFGAGEVELVAVARFEGGHCARSAPVTIDVADAEGAAASPAPAPVAYGYRRVLRGSGPFVIELPATFADPLASATYAVVDEPANATLGAVGDGPVRLVTPSPSAAGADRITFRVTTPSGQSELGVIDLVYGDSDGPPEYALSKGRLDDRRRPGRDSFTVVGTLPPSDVLDAAAFDPSALPIALELGGACGAIRARAEPGAGRWVRRGRRWRYRSPRGDAPRLVLRLDPVTRVLRVQATRGEFREPPSGAIGFSISLGDLRASSNVQWLESSRRPGRFRYAP